ncbi:D-alanyl-D-alanine carboxypeptidase family protein [Rhodococcus sp. NPDC058514]|uniref:D-alanyl-D-alanine carboxypeptidase family protein n=1 Tax=unclassified Rhodococcus (in: high G+C Gram-positive bacteria) TaxID=192944 RepID=UPI00365C5E83
MTAPARALTALAAVASIALVGAPAVAQPSPGLPESSTTTTTPFTTPNTDTCPHRNSPPKAIDLSEVPAPGQEAPSALPVPARPVGGKRLGECGAVAPDGAPPLPADISATGWVLADLDSGTVIAAKDPHGRYRPASTIKLLLAILALRELDLDTTVTATADDANAEGSAVGLGKDGRYTNRQLMQGLVMASGNDAAHALAAQFGGDERTVEKMNELARSLGALDTRTATPSGLDGPGMSSSAYDLAIIFREAMRDKTFAEFIQTESVPFPGFPKDPTDPEDKDHPGFILANDNKLLYNYDGALGGKTGFTDDARQTFVGAAERNGRTLVVTLMAGEVKPIRPWEQAARLLDYGFALPASESVGTLIDPGEAQQAAPVTLAAPPDGPGGPITATGPDDSTPGFSKTAVAVIGSAIVGMLLVAAGRLRRRR